MPKIIRWIKEMARIHHYLRGETDALKSAKENGIWVCPRCEGWMTHPPKDYNICPHCKREFGYDATESEGIRIFWPPDKTNG